MVVRKTAPKRSSSSSPALAEPKARRAPAKLGKAARTLGVADQMRSAATTMIDLGAGAISAARTLRVASSAARALGGGSPLQAAKSLLGAIVSSDTRRSVKGAARAGAALRKMREAAGYTVDEVGAAINLRDPALLETLESGKAALPFELILRLAAVLGRNDPVGFVMKLTRTSNPDLWQNLESLGVGRLLLQSAREREFANIYRTDDSARRLSDENFTAVLAFTKAAFEMAMALHVRSTGTAKKTT
jgi:transcriptional regulator with XRE-family HTH domain